ARERIREMTKPSGEAEPLSDEALLTEFVDAARKADSSGEAIQIALAFLCSRLGVDSGVLLAKESEAEFSSAASTTPSAAKYTLPANGVLIHRLRFCAQPLAIAGDDYTTWLQWANETELQYAEEIESLHTLRTRVAIALRGKDDIVGVLLLGPPSGRN